MSCEIGTGLALLKYKVDWNGRTGKRWELMFLGKIYSMPKGGSQHMVDAVFSSIDARRGQYEIHTKRIGIGELPYLIPGSIWVSKIRAGEHFIQIINPVEFGEKEINTLNLFNAETVPQIELADFENFKDPLRLFRSLRAYSRMPVFSIDIKNNPNFKIFIPPIELFRFTFAKTTRLAVKITHRTMDDLATHVRSQDIDGKRVVTLRSSVPKSRSLTTDEAQALATAYDTGLASEFSQSGWSAVRRSVDEYGEPIKDGEFLKGKFFWKTGDKFRSIGHMLDLGNKVYAFFVQGILETNHHPSFNRIDILECQSIKRQTDYDQRKNMYPGAVTATIGEEIESVEGPKTARASAKYTVQLPEPELGVAKIEVLKIEESTDDYETDNKKVIGGDKPKASSTGEAVGNNGRISGLEVDQADNQEFDSLREIKILWDAALKIQEDLKFEVCSVKSDRPAASGVRRGDKTAQLCQFYPKSGEARHKWSTKRIRGKTFVRRALCVQFKNNKKFAYAIEVERFSENDNYCLFTFSLNSQAEIKPEMLDQFLLILANSESRRLAKDLPNSLGLTSLKFPHYETRQSVDGLANAIGPFLFNNLDGLMLDIRK